MQGFFAADVWEARLQDLPTGRALAYRVARILFSTWKGFHAHQITSRAAALTYYTVLSIVPFLAFAFALLKGFGAYDRFVNQTVRPYVEATFGANPPLRKALEKVLEFVHHTDVGRLGTVGVFVLLYGAVSLVRNVESALNEIWGARSERSLLRQVTDYTTLIVTTPLLILVATTFATGAQSSGVVSHLRHTWALGAVIDLLLGLTSLVVTVAAIIGLYIILPNLKVRTSSAVLGGVVSGLLWQLALVIHVNAQAGVARYNALYSGFVALPIFLVWTYTSWAIVLMGGVVAASHQNERAARQRLRAEAVDQALKEALALAIAARITAAFLSRRHRPTAASLAEQLEVSPLVVQDLLEALAASGLVAKVLGGREIGYLPAEDVDQVRASDILAAIRRRPEADPLRTTLAENVGPEILTLVDATELFSQRHPRPDDLTLRELCDIAREDRGATSAPAGAAQEGDEASASAVDGKQPDLPS
jgi:membrane protein